MKKNLFTFIAIVFSLSLAAQVTNSGFEDWTIDTNFSHPDVSPANFSSVNNQSFFYEGNLGVTEVAAGVVGSAIHLETFSYDGDTLGAFGIFGNLPNGDSLVFSGGFPFTDVTVSGMTMDIRYDINPLSPGFFLVQFLANGVPVTGGPNDDGTYLFQFSGMETDWTSVTFDFLPSLTQIPDECVIAFGCNDLINDSIFFVGDWLEIDNIEFEGTMMADVPGGDFETWEDITSETVDYWDTYLPPFFDFVTSTENSYSGDLAIQLETKDFEGQGQQAMIYQAELSEEGLFPNQPLEPDSYAVQFHYQFSSPSESENAIVYLLLSEQENPAPEDIYFVASTLNQTDGWIQSSIEFQEEFPSANYYGLIFFSGGGFDVDGEIGSILLLDDVSFLTIDEDCDFVPSIIGAVDTVCVGGDLALSTQTYDSYQWFASENDDDEFFLIDEEPTLTADEAEVGVYELFVLGTLDGCTASSDTITIVVVDGPSPTVFQDGDFLETESGMNSYTWYYNGSVIGNTEMVEIQGNGAYAVVVENNEGCEGQSDDFEVTGVSIEEFELAVEIYPNPANENLYIQLDNTGSVEIEIYNLVGELVLSKQLNEQMANNINVSKLSNGSYVIRILSNDQMMTQNMVINR